jgi:hypothetical protein
MVLELGTRYNRGLGLFKRCMSRYTRPLSLSVSPPFSPFRVLVVWELMQCWAIAFIVTAVYWALIGGADVFKTSQRGASLSLSAAR